MSRLALVFAVATAALAPVTAHAGIRVPFEQTSFAAAQAANKPILVEVHAWWCPTCASQSRTIEAALAEPRNRDLVVFRINYDKQKPQWQAFGVHKQGTLIAFRGHREAGRLEFVTDKGTINTLISRATS